MIFNLVIGLILVLGFLVGFRRGFVTEVLSLVGFLISMTAGFLLTTPITNSLIHLFLKDDYADGWHMIIRLIVFTLLFSTVWQVIRIIRRGLQPVTKLPVISQANALLGGGVSLITRYLIIYIILNFLILFPNQEIHQQYNESAVSQWIVKQTPMLSQKLVDFWTSHTNEGAL